jgi:hypothetical protein
MPFDRIQAGFYMCIHKMAFEPLVGNNLVIQARKEKAPWLFKI